VVDFIEMNDDMEDDDADLIDQVSDDDDMDDDAPRRQQRGRNRQAPVDDEPPLQGYSR
jgi:hypothetical protein